MKSHPATIFLGDYARALKLLAPADDATRQAIAELLGLERVPVELEAAPPAPTRLPVQSEPAPEAPPIVPEPADQTPSPAAPQTPAWLASTLEPLPRTSGEWVFPADPLPETAMPETIVPPPLRPLFVPSWTRGILSASLATMSEDGPLDIQRLADTVARGAAIQKLYRLPWPTLRRGAQLLIDRAEALEPFWRDQRWLQEVIVRTVGTARVEVLRFANCPTRGAGKGPKRSWAAYQAPAPGTVVAILTDLGIGEPPFASEYTDVAEWRAFARALWWHDCPIVAFVPYPPERYPRGLAKLITIVQWGRGTTAATIKRLVGRAREVT
jgi:hypothetical protein